MMFCPKCGSVLLPHKSKDKVIVKCKCGYKGEIENAVITEKVEKQKEIEVVEERTTHPVVEAECPKCGNDKAEYWTSQTRAADEAETRFFKCTKCRHTWREYD